MVGGANRSPNFTKRNIMNLDKFLQAVGQAKIPESSPIELNNEFGNFRTLWDAREYCTKRGMWAIVDKTWTKVLADWIGNRTVLEVMAGAGWLAKALSEHGVAITATDDYSWDGKKHTQMTRVHPVIKAHSLEAVLQYNADILLVSWPPRGDETWTATVRLWGNDKPIVYIGEGCGGYNAPDSFFEKFEALDVHIPLQSWTGLNDTVEIGYWRE